MLNENQIRIIASIFNAYEIKNYIEKNKIEFYIYEENEHIKSNNVESSNTLSIKGGIE